MKLIIKILSIVLLSAGLQAANLESVVKQHKPLLKHTLSRQSSQIDGRFREFAVTPSDSIVADTARYEVEFLITAQEDLTLHLGGVILAFPEGFDLSRAEVGELTDNHPNVNFLIRSTFISANVISIEFDRKRIEPGPLNRDTAITFTLDIADVINTDTAGEYRLSGLAFDVSGAILAGPALSQPFRIIPRDITSLVVIPDNDTTLAAGEAITFRAVGLDSFGNQISDLTPDWTLVSESDPIGILTGATLQARKVGVGRVVATYQDLSAASGILTVEPGPLARLDLTIPLEQVTRIRLRAPSTVTLYDGFGNLRTNHDLLAEPVVLASADGNLVPETIDDNVYLADGFIDLNAVGVTHSGPSAVTTVEAAAGTVVSNTEDVSFSGYEILGLLGPNGSPLTEVVAGAVNNAVVVIQNNGLTAAESLVLDLVFASGGDSVRYPVSGGANGAIDTIPVELNPGAAEVTIDLAVKLEAAFDIGGESFTVSTDSTVTLSVISESSLQLLTGQIAPNTIYPGSPFGVAFDLGLDGFDGSIDSTRLVLSLVNSDRTLFEGFITPTDIASGVITYENLSATLPTDQAMPAGADVYGLDIRVYADGRIYSLVATANEVTVLEQIDLPYVPASLRPPEVAAGHSAAFQFDIDLQNSYPLILNPLASVFTVAGNGFASSTSLSGTVTDLAPGTTTLSTQGIFIPEDQLGVQLQFAATLNVSEPTTGAVVPVPIDFGGETVRVRDLPVAQIVSLEVVAPNPPRVNVNQPFQMRSRIANLSDVPIGPLTVRLTSDGSSTFDSLASVERIPANDTLDVFFDVVASASPTDAEIFRVKADFSQTAQVIFQPPTDNIAIVRIELPAQLELDYTLFGVTGGIVDQNTPFGLSVEVMNLGEADAGNGEWFLTTGGIEFGTDDSLTGTITPDKHIEFSFVSPPVDTTVTMHFVLTEVPLDLNTAQRALIQDTSITLEIRVESQDADLLVAVTALGSNLVTPSETKELFQMDLTNRGVSALTTIRLDSVGLEVRRENNQPVAAYRVFDPSRCGVTEGGDSLEAEITVANDLTIMLDGFQIEAGETRSIVFVGGFSPNVLSSFTLSLQTSDIRARFVGGSQDGRPVRVSTENGAFLLTRTYAVRGAGLEESFIVEDNPFDPRSEPARFSYKLTEPSGIEFRVFTLTGEEVFARDLTQAELGPVESEQEIQWDGRNNEGEMVNNGVYVATIKMIATGEQAVMKVAVVK